MLYSSGRLFHSGLDVSVKRGAELSTNYHLVDCNLHLRKLTGLTPMCWTKRSYWIKCEAIADNDMRKILKTAYFTCSESSLSAQSTPK